MTKDEALRLALEALELCTNQGMIPMYLNKNKDAITAIKAALEAKDEPVAQGSIQHLKIMMEESSWEGRIELSDVLANIDEFYTTTPQLEAKDEPYAFEASMYPRVIIDPVTGNVSIGTVTKACGLECDCTDVCKQDDYKALWQQMCERCDELDKKLAQLEAKDELAPVAKNEAGRITWMIDDWPQNCLLYTHPPQSFTYEQVKAHIRAASMSANDISVGSDTTEDGVSIVIRRRDELLYAEFFAYTPPQRTWVGLTDEDYIKALELCDFDKDAAFEFFEDKLKELNT